MTHNILAKALHSINDKRLPKKSLALCISALFIVSMISVLGTPTATAATTSALHTQDSYVLDSNRNTVYLRGMGLAGFAPNLMLWGSGGSDNWGNQWNYNPTAVMDQTFEAMKNQWHINMIRVFVYPSWWYRDSIVPAQESSAYSSSTTPISIKEYMKTLCQEADKYGIYVNVVPYTLTPSSSSYDLDKYASSSFSWQGLPMSGWEAEPQRFLNDIGYGNNEAGFWSWFWADMATTLKDYPNAIFEAWNEPSVGSDVDMIPSTYMTYLQTMYNAIRGTGSNHIIMMQWHMGWFPNGYGNTLSWVKQIDDAFHPNNVVYTTHFYYYAPSDLSSYWAKDYTTLKSQIQTGIDSMGIVAPLVINEEGSCLTNSPNKQNDYTWWRNLLLAQRDLNVGAGAYYWLSDAGLGGVFAGESMLSSGYSPNTMGQAYIDTYQATTTNPTVAPAPIATPTNAPTPPAAPAVTNVGNLAGGRWINQAHYNTGDMGPYDITYTQAGTSASGIPNIDNCYLPAEIFRGYSRWDANGGYFDLRSTPILSFDLWVDKVMQIEVGLVDTTNGYSGGFSTLLADTYHNGQANTPPYDNLYGTGTVKSADGAWIVMLGPTDKSTTHYTVDLRTLGVSLSHLGQIVFDFTCGHQADINWKIYNVVVSSDVPTPTATPSPTPTPTPTSPATPTPTPTVTPSPIPSPTSIPTATPTTAPTAQPTTTPTPEPTTNPTQTPQPIATATPTETPTSNSKPAATTAPTTNPTTPATSQPIAQPIQTNFFNYWNQWFSWSRFSGIFTIIFR